MFCIMGSVNINLALTGINENQQLKDNCDFKGKLNNTRQFSSNIK